MGTEVPSQTPVSRGSMFQAMHSPSLSLPGEPPASHPLFGETRFAIAFSDCGMERAIALRASIAKSAMK